MGKFILDTNIIIKLWKKDNIVLERFLEFNEILIVREVLEELSKKEKRLFNGEYIMSERFMSLVPFMKEIDRLEFRKFINSIDFEKIKGKAYYFKKNKITEIDMILIYSSKINTDFKLVTEDIGLFESAKLLLGEDKVLRLNDIFS